MGGLTRGIDVEDHPLGACSIPQATCLLLCVQRASQQIRKYERAQGFNRLRGQGSQKARERRAIRQPVPSEQAHERERKREQMIIEVFQRAFATDGIANQESHKVDDLIASEPTPRKADAL